MALLQLRPLCTERCATEVTMDQVLKVWTTCEATVEERWILRTSSDVGFDGDGCSILDLLDTDVVEVLAVENVEVHSERERTVTRVEFERAT